MYIYQNLRSALSVALKIKIGKFLISKIQYLPGCLGSMCLGSLVVCNPVVPFGNNFKLTSKHLLELFSQNKGMVANTFCHAFKL